MVGAIAATTALSSRLASGSIFQTKRIKARPISWAAMRPGARSLPCTSAEAVPINEPVSYRIPIVGTGYRFAVGHRLRLILTSDDQDPKFPAEMSFRHASVGTSSLNRIASSSRLLLPVTAGML
jgi:uncharacterized protein